MGMPPADDSVRLTARQDEKKNDEVNDFFILLFGTIAALLHHFANLR
jgi:hypothetical protein